MPNERNFVQDRPEGKENHLTGNKVKRVKDGSDQTLAACKRVEREGFLACD